MLSKTKVLSAAIGLAMLALPTAAFAGHHDGRFHGRGWHHGWNRGWHGGWRGRGGWGDRGWHNGWYARGDDDDDGGRRGWGGPGYGCDDDCGGGRWNGNLGGYNNGNFFRRDAYSPNQLNSLIAQRQRTTIELERMRARGDSRGAARMATVLQGLNGRIARAQGGYGYRANAAPLTGYPGAYNPYGGYPYYGNSVNAIGSLMGPLLGVR